MGLSCPFILKTSFKFFSTNAQIASLVYFLFKQVVGMGHVNQCNSYVQRGFYFIGAADGRGIAETFVLSLLAGVRNPTHLLQGVTLEHRQG